MFIPPRPAAGGGGPTLPRPPPFRVGGVLTGTVKSYNAKGFGFILSDSIEHDIYFSRESLQQGLRTANIAGTVVNFELVRGPGGKPLARNLRPVHGVPPNFFNARGSSSFNFASVRGKGVGLQPVALGIVQPPVAPPVQLPRPQRSLSPHAGSRAIAGLKKEEAQPASPSSNSSSESQSSSRLKKRGASRSSATSSRKRKKTRQKRVRSRSSYCSDGSKADRKRRKCSSSSSSSRKDLPSGAPDLASAETEGNKDIEEAKREALAKLQALQGISNKDTRMKEWRALLRTWHPDKNPENVEVATAVFQFLQKGKILLDGN